MAFLSIFFILTLTLLSNLAQNGRSSQPGALHRDVNRQIMYANFRAAFNQHLSTTVIASFLTKNIFTCPYKCIAKSECFSYNLAAYPDNGFYLCEFLATDKYRARKDLKLNASFHHFSPMVSCGSSKFTWYTKLLRPKALFAASLIKVISLTLEYR